MNYDVIVIGAGAAGLMCAITAAKRKRRVLVVDHSNKVGKKILISGGGRCNFTHLYATPKNYLSQNPHFCISALNRYTPYDFLEMVNKYGIAYHEKTAGQLFCDESSKMIVTMLLAECAHLNVEIFLNTKIYSVKKGDHFQLASTKGELSAESLVIASGGLSFPTMGASSFGYKIAEQFNLNVLPVRAGLVPFTLLEKDLQHYKKLSGISTQVSVSAGDQSFTENLLFTHRGLSGPAMLQISSYWKAGEKLKINWFPDIDFFEWLKEKKQAHPKATLKNILSEKLTQRVANCFADMTIFPNESLNQFSEKKLKEIAESLEQFDIKPNGTEGYRTAEVTLGGVDTDELSSKTMMSQKVEGLYFIGEVVDVTGQLGGYNFQWAWASGFCAGQYV